MRIWRRWVFPTLLIIILGAASAALVKIAFVPDSSEAALAPEAGINDPVVPVERGSIVNELTLSGTIAQDESVTIRSEVNGVVTAVHVKDGDRVASGQKLFTVKQDYPVVHIDILAPEAGEISEIAVVKEQQTNVGADVAKLAPERFHVLATVAPVQLYRLVDAPSEATVTITGGPAPFACTGVRMQVATDGSASVRCSVPGDQVVFSGLPAQLDLALGQVDDALIVPVTAVQGGSGSGVVWVETGDSGEPEERSVTLGVNDGDVVEVTDGLAEGDMIRQFVPGFAAPVEEFCWEAEPGVEICESGSSW